MTTGQNRKRVQEFYEATAPGHRERLFSLQDAHVVYKMPEGLPVAAGLVPSGVSTRAASILCCRA